MYFCNRIFLDMHRYDKFVKKIFFCIVKYLYKSFYHTCASAIVYLTFNYYSLLYTYLIL